MKHDAKKKSKSRNAHFVTSREDKRMKGICKTDNALYVGRFLDGTTVSIGLNRQQRWQFETTSDGRVRLTFRNIVREA